MRAVFPTHYSRLPTPDLPSQSLLPLPLPLPLSRPYRSRDGSPVLTHADEQIFTRRYFAACLACGFCRDACCDHGVDADAATVGRILAQADAIEARIGVKREAWFTGPLVPDDDLPGGAATRTSVVDGGCVFRSRTQRGCLLHAYAIETGQDYHLLKPMVSTLFPLTFDGGVLCVSSELEDGSLVCGGSGPTAYEAVRSELAYYFGGGLVEELDRLASTEVQSSIPSPSLPVTVHRQRP